MNLLRPFALAFAAFLTLAASPAEQKWAGEIKEGNAAYATNRLAMLKIDDAVYLKPGQSAWLVRDGGKVAWSTTEKLGALLELGLTPTNAIEARRGPALYSVRTDVPYRLSSDLDLRVQETQVSAGELGIRAFVYNQKNPTPATFKGLSYFPYDAAWKLTANFTPATPKPLDFQTSRGTSKRFWHVGAATFTAKGAQLSLPLYAENEKGAGMSAFFLDATTGKTSYSAGRYIDAEFAGAFPPKTVTLDFNYAYNPNCARSPFYTCPLTKDRLAIAVEAGEKAPPPH